MSTRLFDVHVVSRWRRLGADNRLIARGMITVGVFALLAKLAGAAKEVGVAWRYGVGAEIDAYLFVFNLVTLPASIWFSVLTVVLIPLDNKLRERSPDQARIFRAELLGASIVLGGVLFVAARFGLPRLLTSSWVGLPPHTAQIASTMTPLFSWLPLLGLVIGLYSTWLMSAGGYWNTLFEGLPAVGILGAVLLTGGVGALLWGTLVGFVAQLVCVALPATGHKTWHLPRLGMASEGWAPFRQAFGIMVIGQAVMSLTAIVDQFFAARLPEGAISSLGYSNRLLALILGIVATAITRATLPVFSRSAAAGGTDMRAASLRWARLLGLAGVVTFAVGWLLAPFGVHVMFERGTFTATDTVTVSNVFRMGLLQLPFYFASLVLVAAHSSQGRYRLLLLSGIVGLAVKLLGNSLFVPVYGVGGLMVSAALMYAANALLLAVVKR